MPAEFLGLNRNSGFQQLTNVGRSTYHAFQSNVRGRFGTRAFFTVGYTFGKSLDTLSSDRSLVEHDPARPENNYGPSDYDRPHRLSTAWVLSLPGVGERGLLAGAHARLAGVGPLHVAVGHAVHGARRVDDQRDLRAGRRACV